MMQPKQAFSWVEHPVRTEKICEFGAEIIAGQVGCYGRAMLTRLVLQVAVLCSQRRDRRSLPGQTHTKEPGGPQCEPCANSEAWSWTSFSAKGRGLETTCCCSSAWSQLTAPPSGASQRHRWSNILDEAAPFAEALVAVWGAVAPCLYTWVWSIAPSWNCCHVSGVRVARCYKSSPDGSSLIGHFGSEFCRRFSLQFLPKSSARL